MGTAILTSISFIVLRNGACGRPGFALDFNPATLVAFLFGFVFRLAAIWIGWEVPTPKVAVAWLEKLPKRETLKEKMQPGWELQED